MIGDTADLQPPRPPARKRCNPTAGAPSGRSFGDVVKECRGPGAQPFFAFSGFPAFDRRFAAASLISARSRTISLQPYQSA